MTYTKYIPALAMAIAAPALFGSAITPGTSGLPDVFISTPGSLTYVDSISSNINPSPGNSFNGTYREYVYRDTAQSASAGCTAVGGCLDFWLIFKNDGPAGTIIERATMAGFAGFITDAGYYSSPWMPGNVVPSTVDRSTDPSGVVGFNFISGTGGTPVGSGDTSAYLVVQTNATNYQAGVVSLQDGFAGSGAGFEPTAAATATAATPEPGTVMLMGSALLGVGLLRRRLVRN